MSRPAASVVIPSRGGANRLPVLLDALAEQDTDNFEVIVVLDGDIDGSAAIADAESRFPCHVVEFPENRGRVAALNAGFERTRGNVLIRCDDDLEPQPGHVSGHIARHTGEQHGVVGPVDNVFDDTPYARAYGHDASRLSLRGLYATADGMQWRHWGANCSITRDTWNVVGRYDPRYRLYGWEDVDYGYRIHTAGLPVVIAPEVMAPHHVGAMTAEGRIARAYLSGAARTLFEQAHGTDVLPEPRAGDGAWGRAVATLAGRLDEDKARAYGRRADRAAARLPAAAARKVIALGVEAAALAGYRHPGSARDTL